MTSKEFVLIERRYQSAAMLNTYGKTHEELAAMHAEYQSAQQAYHSAIAERALQPENAHYSVELVIRHYPEGYVSSSVIYAETSTLTFPEAQKIRGEIEKHIAMGELLEYGDNYATNDCLGAGVGADGRNRPMNSAGKIDK